MLFYVIARKRAVFALRAEFSSLSFPKEKRTKKKGNLRACALKNPPIVQSFCAQSKTVCLSLLLLQVALCAMKLYEIGKEQKAGASVARAYGEYCRAFPRLFQAFGASSLSFPPFTSDGYKTASPPSAVSR